MDGPLKYALMLQGGWSGIVRLQDLYLGSLGATTLGSDSEAPLGHGQWAANSSLRQSDGRAARRVTLASPTRSEDLP